MSGNGKTQWPLNPKIAEDNCCFLLLLQKGKTRDWSGDRENESPWSSGLRNIERSFGPHIRASKNGKLSQIAFLISLPSASAQDLPKSRGSVVCLRSEKLTLCSKTTPSLLHKRQSGRVPCVVPPVDVKSPHYKPLVQVRQPWLSVDISFEVPSSPNVIILTL